MIEFPTSEVLVKKGKVDCCEYLLLFLRFSFVNFHSSREPSGVYRELERKSCAKTDKKLSIRIPKNENFNCKVVL